MSQISIQVQDLKAYCTRVLGKSIPFDEALIVVESLLDADLMGIHSHGVSRLADYLKRMEEGLIERKTQITLEHETQTTARLNANNGWGQVVSVKAMNMAIDKALVYGTGFVGVNNSNHNGTASYYTRMAAAQGCIGIAMTNTSATMVPFGAREPSLGTNPISICVPSGDPNKPVFLDMATSNVARGKIILAKKNGERIPEGWAITREGNPTTDPVEALDGFMLPMGAKGSGLGMMVDILSGVLTGANFGKAVPRMYEDPEPQRIGHFFGAIQVGAFMEEPIFYQRMQEKIDETVTSAPMQGFDRVYMPGEPELNRKVVRQQQGIPISDEVYGELKQTGLKYGVDLSEFIDIEIPRR